MLIDLTSKTQDELRTLAREHKTDIGDLPPNLGEGKLRDAVEAGLLRRQKRLEREAGEQADRDRQAKLGAQDRAKGHPDPETVAIENSEKVYVTFVNMENPGQDGELGADVPMFSGSKYTFHLWDQQRHVMPKCLVVSNPEDDEKLLKRMVEFWTALGLVGNHALKQAKEQLHRMSLANRCHNDRTELRYNKRDDTLSTVIVGTTPRFRFTDAEPAPADAEYGLVIKEMNHGENSPNQSEA
jgi:hypothetical protein